MCECVCVCVNVCVRVCVCVWYEVISRGHHITPKYRAQT